MMKKVVPTLTLRTSPQLDNGDNILCIMFSDISSQHSILGASNSRLNCVTKIWSSAIFHTVGRVCVVVELRVIF